LRGELVLTEQFVSDELSSRVKADSVQRVAVALKKDHVVLDMGVGRMGLRYQLLASYRLVSTEFGPDGSAEFCFRDTQKAVVRPENFAAKALRIAPALIPKVGPILGAFLRVFVDELMSALVRHKVDSGAKSIGGRETGADWHFALEEHPLKVEVDVPGVGKLPLLGGVVVVKQVELRAGKLVARLGVADKDGVKQPLGGATATAALDRLGIPRGGAESALGLANQVMGLAGGLTGTGGLGGLFGGRDAEKDTPSDFGPLELLGLAREGFRLVPEFR
jgi:hypothetical protein